MKRLFHENLLYLISGAIALSIMGLSAFSLWRDHEIAWADAERTSRNLQTALAQDIANNLDKLDSALKKISLDVADESLLDLPPLARHRILFDKIRTASYMDGIFVLNEEGNMIADADSILPRLFNASDREYFQVHKEKPDLGLYLSRPIFSRLKNGDASLALTRRRSHPDGRFAGIISTRVSLSRFDALFKNIDIGSQGSITLFRSDGTVVMRKPYKEGQIGKNLSATPNVQRFIKEGSGTFEGAAALDDVHRLYVFGPVDRFPLILTISKGIDDILGLWRIKAYIQSGLTLLICSAIMGLTILFRRELRRRTRAERKLGHLARTDDLTGLPNRRAFREAYARAWRRASRMGLPISVLYVDADFFKSYNDMYGHARGDEVLRAIAGVLKKSIQGVNELAARYGGEEFVILLPNTKTAEAGAIAQAICHAIRDLDIVHEASSYHRVTVSIGHASAYPAENYTGDLLLKAADMALYEAKKAGRNCVRQSITVQKPARSETTRNIEAHIPPPRKGQATA